MKKGEEMRRLYLFDFDGTLTNKDTLFDFLSFSFSEKYIRIFIQFIPLFTLTKFKILDAGKVKEKFIASFLKGKTQEEIKNFANEYFDKKHKSLIKKTADEYLRSINNYHDKYIVSASLDIWLEPFAEYYGMGLICTKASFNSQGVFDGKFLTPNCNYREKTLRIESEIDLKRYDEILAFGDTKGDNDMLNLANQSYYRYF